MVGFRGRFRQNLFSLESSRIQKCGLSPREMKKCRRMHTIAPTNGNTRHSLELYVKKSLCSNSHLFVVACYFKSTRPDDYRVEYISEETAINSSSRAEHL